MREIADHKGSPLDNQISVRAVDEPGAAGANHDYVIELEGGDAVFPLFFQNGPVLESGPNGISNESVISVVADRLRGFQNGPHACTENALALHHLEMAMTHLQVRTQDRVSRGVEGTNEH